MGVGVAGVVNYCNTSSGTASNVVAYGGVGGPYEYCSFFSVLNWFAAGEQGAWYDPSDFQPNWRRNLLTWSEDFSNAAWSKVGVTITSNSIIGPNNVLDASTIKRTTTGSNEAMVRFVSAQIANTVYTVNIYVKLGTIGTSLYLRNLAIDAGIVTGLVKFNLTTGTVDLTFGATYAGKTSIVSVGNDWYRCSITGTTLATIAANGIDIGVTSSATIGGSANDYLYIDYAQLEQSSSPSTYQKITDGIQDYYTVQPQPVLFQDSAGTIPVTAVEQPVGLMLDKSKGLALGAELVTNGTFDVDISGVTQIGGVGIIRDTSIFTTGGLKLTAIQPGNSGIYAQISIPTVVGATYSLSADLYAPATNSVSLSCFLTATTTAGTEGINISANGVVQRKTCVFSATSTTTLIKAFIMNHGVAYGTTGDVAYYDNISVKQIAGNHAFQATAGNRPTLSARVNGLLATATLSTQSVTSLATNYTLAFTGAGTVTLSGTATGTLSAGSNTFTATAGTLTLTVSGSVTLADLRPTNSGALLPPYQRVNTASDYDTVGFPLYLKANGTSSAMSTNSIDFTATDKMTVVTGVRKLSDAAQGMFIELNVDTSGNGSFYCIASPGNSAGWGGLSKGTIARAPQVVTGYIAPISDVYTLLNDISAPFSKLILNSKQVDSNISSQGIGNFGNYPFYLFARAGTSLFLNGQFYGAIIRGAQSDTASVTQTENYMAQKTGITF